jgi:NAD(P)H-dependent flavin oxidoreductase YrpB (nitropropane dioxygenase family)
MCNLFNIIYSILQGEMAHSKTAETSSAVLNSGEFGAIGSGFYEYEQIR